MGGAYQIHSDEVLGRFRRLAKLCLMRRPSDDGMLRRLFMDERLMEGRAEAVALAVALDGRRAVGVTQHGQTGAPVEARLHMCDGLSTASSKMGIDVGSRFHMGDGAAMGMSEMNPPAAGRSHIGADRISLCSGKSSMRFHDEGAIAAMLGVVVEACVCVCVCGGGTR